VVIDYLISENAKSAETTLQESEEMSESMDICEPTPLTFTHDQTTDHAGYYFNEALQTTTGEYACYN
jgi:hypothetical protein